MSSKNLPDEEPLPIGKKFRQLFVFQFKLLADALRDLVLSPLSVIAFIIDAVLRTKMQESLTKRLMMLGRHSDRVINLFNEYSNTENYTLDNSIEELEAILYKKIEQRKEKQQNQHD